MNNQASTTTSTGTEKYNQIPADFPMTALQGAISGVQEKLLLTEHDGKFYPLGTSPQERFQRWEICDDLVRQFSEKSLGSKTGKRAHMSEVEILQQYYERLLKIGWVSDAESVWVINSVSDLLSWSKLAIRVQRAKKVNQSKT
ncbi:hypothetical protein LPB67_12670 [Undibacterium sp. Jales W-56]|uniref:hypothetical protein n=1 Tax=Undibacterium sp. Jales W-56 TaxID=2897325 RepID=UPI0021D2488D|nr:hypothetical protein [Undibacterium sp. Jales W-56]MCU6434625.1 hypothetical protein [Undibacterium sp. Jales W-56]